MVKEKEVIVKGAGQGIDMSITEAFAAQKCNVLLINVKSEAAQTSAKSVIMKM